MHEIIHVVDVASPSGAARHGLEIEAVDHQPLRAGYYFVLWPLRKGAKKRGKRYFGPLRTAAEARLLATSAVMLGLAEDVQPRPSIAECRSIVRHATAANDCCSIPRPTASPARQAAG
ncbi:MAG: hypothetical protein ACM3Y9_01150 [Ignavibacteria bacterium]